MVVEIRDGTRYLVCGDKLIRDGGYMELCDYTEDLLCTDDDPDYDVSDFDIMVVYKEVCTLYAVTNTTNVLWERKELLDKVEKKYLESTLKPFKDNIKHIVKKIAICGKTYLFVRLFDGDFMEFPFLKNEDMYGGLGLGIHYSPKELHLWEDTH